MTSSSNRPRVSSDEGGPGLSSGGSAADSLTTAGSGRGAASPQRMVVASAVSMACASSGCGLHFSGGTRIWVRGSVSGCSARQSMAAIASWRRATGESWSSGTVSDSST